MAATREKRANAGNKMARLLNEEEEDDFYKTTYGGFDEVDQDHDYMFVASTKNYSYIYITKAHKIYKYLNFREEDEAEDEVDSDFSIDENDEPVSDTEQEGPKKKRRLITKAYKEPKPATLHAQSASKERKIKQLKQDKNFIDNIGNTNILAGIKCFLLKCLLQYFMQKENQYVALLPQSRQLHRNACVREMRIRDGR